MAKFENKLVAVMNKSIEPGTIFNALGHMCMGFGAHIGLEKMRLTDYKNADGGSHPYISEMPFIILRANSNKIRGLRHQSIEKGIEFVDYSDTMIIGTYEDQLKRSAETKEEDLTYFGIVLFGPWDEVSEMTKKFSLWK
ncbi:MAG: hypothetical protein KR126chlam3_00188 [Chlamydiae bacterium]|nr:hypothetical protein [Chlamydiota bacterium]